MILNKWMTYGISFAIGLSALSLNGFNVYADASNWAIEGEQDWIRAYPSNFQNDYLQDQQTGSGSVSQDIVGDATYPSVYRYVADDEIAFRVRVSNINGGTSLEGYDFKNFVFAGLDVDLDGSVDFFLGTYNPSGSNGRIAIYSSATGYLNLGPSTTGISGKPLAAFEPVRNVNYAITGVTDGSNFNGDSDYFVSFKIDLETLVSTLQENGFANFTTSSPFAFMTGTAAQDNSFNQDINGMDGSGWSSGKTWTSLGVFSDIVSLDGTANYCKVIFDKNTGDTDASPAIKAVLANTSLTILPTSPTKRGMYFMGWNTRPDGSGDKVTAATVINGDTTVYATWSDKATSVVTFDANGGTIGGTLTSVDVATIDGIVGDNMPADPINSKRYFMGWNTQADGKGTYFNSTTLVESNLRVYAQWANNTAKVAEFYDNHDGTGGNLVAKIYSNGNSNNFNGNLPVITRLGYTFEGWYLNDVTGTTGKIADISAPGKYYAKWAPASYLLTFDGNGSGVTNVPSPKTITGGYFGVLLEEPTRPGFQFVEWNRSPDGTGEALVATSIITQNTTAYAIWKPVTTITFDVNGGSTANQEILAVDGVLEYLPQPPERANYSFAGWGTSQNANEPASLMDVSGYTRLYAIWIQVSEVTFDLNSGIWQGGASEDKIIATSNGNVLYVPNDPIKTDYEFSGWNTRYDGTGDEFTLAYAVTGDMTVYAQWKPLKALYEVDFQTNGGSPVDMIQAFRIDTEPATTKNGYEFSGWYSDATLSAISQVSFPLEVTSDMTLYAKWTPLDYNITYDLDGGNLQPGNPSSYTTETGTFTLANPTKAGYEFSGWSGTGLIQPSKEVTVPKGSSGDKSYGAQWTASQYATIFNGNLGTFANDQSTEDIDQTFGTAFLLPSSAPSRPGYEFSSWNTKSDGTGAVITGSAIFSEAQETILYAQWSELGKVTINYASQNSQTGTVSESFESVNPETGAPSGSVAAPAPGYHFVGWVDEANDVVGTNVVFVPQPSSEGKFAPANYTAIFAPDADTPYKVEHYLMDTTGSYPEVPSSTEQLIGETMATIAFSDLVASNYESQQGIAFAFAQVGNETVSSVAIAPDGSLVVRIYYVRSQHQVTLTKGYGIAAISGSGTYYVGATVTISSQPMTGYEFLEWDNSSNPDVALTGNQNAFVMPDAAVDLEAVASKVEVAGGSADSSNSTNEGGDVYEADEVDVPLETGNDQIVELQPAQTVSTQEQVVETRELIDTGDNGAIKQNIIMASFAVAALFVAIKKKSNSVNK